MTDRTPLEKTAEEKLGEYLKRARQAANIEASELAREIRIPTEMLEHLENGNYDKLPVQAYVRGYLNTICTRLELNRAKVLDWYAGEVGRDYEAVIATDSLAGGSISGGAKSSTSRSSLSTPAGGSGGPNKLVFVVVAVALVLFLVIMNIRGKKDDAEAAQMLRTTDSLDSVRRADSAARTEALTVTDTAGLTADSLADTNKVKDSMAAAQSAAKDSAEASAPVAGKSETSIKFECIKDSTWVRVKKVGGLAWARVVRKSDKPRYLSHNDTMKISIGYPDKARFYINDEQIKIPDNTFKVFNGKIVSK